MTRVGVALILGVTCVFVIGCASTKLVDEEEDARRPLPKPAEILVYDFAFRKDQVSPEAALGARLYAVAEHESQSEESEALGRRVAAELSGKIVEGLTEIGLNARHVAPGAPRPEIPLEGLLEIEGQFIDIDAGNRLERIVIGLGVGASRLTTEVQIFDSLQGGDILVQTFSTRARSGEKPGVAEVAPAGPISVGVNTGAGLLMELRSTAVADSRRTGRLIVRHLAALAYQRGWIDAAALRKAHAHTETPRSDERSGDGA